MTTRAKKPNYKDLIKDGYVTYFQVVCYFEPIVNGISLTPPLATKALAEKMAKELDGVFPEISLSKQGWLLRLSSEKERDDFFKGIVFDKGNSAYQPEYIMSTIATLNSLKPEQFNKWTIDNMVELEALKKLANKLLKNLIEKKEAMPVKPLPKVPNFIMDAKGKYKARRPLTEDQIIKAAKALLKRRFTKGQSFTSPGAVKHYLMAAYANYEYEIFACLFLDNQHKIIIIEEMFRGTIDSASVYPREVVKRALELNSAAVIFAHNHPSGIAEPSKGDKRITCKLKDALNLVDIRVLDHFIIGGAEQYSFADHGLI